MAVRSLWHINNDQTREDTRLAPVGVMTPNPTGVLDTWNGVIPSWGNPLALTSTGAMTAQLGIGRAVVQGINTQGCYPVVVTAPVPLTFDDGDPSLPRIDSVMIVIRDNSYDSTGFTDVQVMVVKGTPDSNPVAPDLPTTASMQLWQVRVNAGTSAGTGGIDWINNLTDVRYYTVAVGGIGVGNSTGAYAGQWRDAGGTAGAIYRYNGTSWESVHRYASNGGIVIGSDVQLFRDEANVLATTDTIRVYRGLTTNNAISLRVTGDTASRMFINADGTVNWGPGGTSSADTNLYRGGANVLQTDDVFRAQVETTSGTFTAASGWSLSFSGGRKTCGVCTFRVDAVRTGSTITPTAGTGNITDTLVATIASGWRPAAIHGSIASDGVGAGEARIETDGTIWLRTWSPGTNIDNTSTVRITGTYVM